jgi:preprotein translocase subunit SecG
MQTVVIVIHLMVVLALTGLVLLQRSEGGGLGMGGGGGGFLTSRGTSNVLTRSTAILAAIFFATSLLLSVLAGLDRKPRSILNSGSPSAPLSAPSPLPLGQGRTIPDPATPAAPAPTGPQVPRSQ